MSVSLQFHFLIRTKEEGPTRVSMGSDELWKNRRISCCLAYIVHTKAAFLNTRAMLMLTLVYDI